MSHIYNDTFFDYIDQGARRSARAFVGHLMPLLQPASVLDLGCGRGVWLDEWRSGGAADVLGVDGDYVDRSRLAVPVDSFMAADLTAPVDTGRSFDLAQSLEVGEHLPTSASETLVDSLTNAADHVLFSAAVTGQGGEFHVNEQPLSFWQAKFQERGFRAFDCIRPHLRRAKHIEPWYRNNAVLYVHEDCISDLPEAIRVHGLAEGKILAEGGDLSWRLRRNIVRHLPQSTVTWIAQVRAARIAARANRAASGGTLTA